MKVVGFIGIAVILSQLKLSMDAVNELTSIEYIYITGELPTDEYYEMRAVVLKKLKESIIVFLIGVLLFFSIFI